MTFKPTDEQRRFLAHACAFVDSEPSQEELDQLVTLARMLLPEHVVEMLVQRVWAVRSGQSVTGPAALEHLLH